MIKPVGIKTAGPAGGLSFGNEAADICVVAPFDTAAEMAIHTFAACELLSRAYPVCVLPTEPQHRAEPAVFLPNGRRMPICQDRRRVKLYLFCDMLGDGSATGPIHLVPGPAPGVLRAAWVVCHSDELPAPWVEALNQRFDLLLVPSPHLLEVAARSGVDVPGTYLPVALDLAASLATKPPPRNPQHIRFGALAAYHPRHDLERLVEAFLDAFGGRNDVDLTLHAGLAVGDGLSPVEALVQGCGAANVHIDRRRLTPEYRAALLRTFHVVVSCARGEGYGAAPREALAAGCALVLSDVGGHRDLMGPPGVFSVPAAAVQPARMPELGGLVAGCHHAVTRVGLARALQEAHAFAGSTAFEASVALRRAAAAAWSFDRLETTYASLVDDALPLFRRRDRVARSMVLPPAARAVVQRKLGERAGGLSSINRVVQPAHDAELAAVFNAFLSHVVWEQWDGRCHAVLPDWDVGRMMAGNPGGDTKRFCYGQPGDGNLWCHLFEAPFGFSDAELNDPGQLYRRATTPHTLNNEHREPLLADGKGGKLYASPRFDAWRRQYHAVFRRHIQLRPVLEMEIAAFVVQHFTDRFVIGIHLPGAGATDGIDRVNAEVARRKLGEKPWRVFLATGEDQVLDQFRDEFGERLTYPTLIADDRSGRSVSMARDAVRAAWLLARCDLLLHGASPVATAVSYMNPALEMVFCPA